MTRTLLLFAALAASLSATATYASLSGDATGVPRQFNLIDAATGATTSPFALGNGTQGFTGGLAESGGLYYSIYNDGFGNNTLASFSGAGSGAFNNLPAVLSQGFYMGLTFNSDTSLLYAWFTPGFGPLQFTSIDAASGAVTSLFSGPNAGSGGMTYRGGGIFDTLLTNANGFFQLHEVNAANGTVTPFGLEFQSNMNGGLAWSPSSNSLLAIGSDNSGFSALYTIAADGSTILNQQTIGGGYFYGALAGASGSVNAVPEPSSWSLVLMGCLLLGVGTLQRKTQQGDSQ